MEKTVEQTIKETLLRMGKEFAEQEGYAELAQINRGECERFAEWVAGELYHFMPDVEIEVMNIREYDFEVTGGHPKPFDVLLEMPYHAWLVYDGKNYDVEAPEGVDYWFQLPFYQMFRDMDEAERKEIFDNFNEDSRVMHDWGLPV